MNTKTACLLCVCVVINYPQPLQPHFQDEVIRNSSFFGDFVCLLFHCSLLETLEYQLRTQILGLFSGFATDSLVLSGTGCTHYMGRSINLCSCKDFFHQNQNYLPSVSATPSGPLPLALCIQAKSLKW